MEQRIRRKKSILLTLPLQFPHMHSVNTRPKDGFQLVGSMSTEQSREILQFAFTGPRNVLRYRTINIRTFKKLWKPCSTCNYLARITCIVVRPPASISLQPCRWQLGTLCSNSSYPRTCPVVRTGSSPTHLARWKVSGSAIKKTLKTRTNAAVPVSWL